MQISSGTTLGRYEIRSLLGAGGMGEVYVAHDTQLRRPVALKFLPETLTRDEERLRRFEQEAYAASGLNHPNILTIYEIAGIEHQRFIAMEYVEGETLRHREHLEPTNRWRARAPGNLLQFRSDFALILVVMVRQWRSRAATSLPT